MKHRLSTVDPSKKWSGPTRPYDIIKEGAIALLVVAILALGLAAIFSSPDEKAVTLQSWSQAAPADFVQTAVGELAGTTTSASYGPPYNTAAEGQTLGPIKFQKWAGVRIPVDPANSFVINPLSINPDQSTTSALSTWKSAGGKEQSSWASAYADALSKKPDATSLPDTAGKYGPVPQLATSLLTMAQNGSLDGALTTSDSVLPTNFTKPLLFLADSGNYFSDLASKQHLSGDQWGVMNETGSWPGQSWLWLYSFWYQVEPFKSSDNADTWVMSLMGLLTLLLALVPKIPFFRKIPLWIPIHRIIWKEWYRSSRR